LKLLHDEIIRVSLLIVKNCKQTNKVKDDIDLEIPKTEKKLKVEKKERK
jgi:hypothetical protein